MGNPAYDKALQLLARRDHFRVELEEKLRRKGFGDDEIASAVGRLDELGLLDDEALARRFVEFRAADRGWGPRRLVAELERRGVGHDLAVGAARIDDELNERALAVALRRASVLAKPGWWRLPERRARLISSLIGRGFAADAARAAVDRLAAERETAENEAPDQPGDPGRLS